MMNLLHICNMLAIVAVVLSATTPSPAQLDPPLPTLPDQYYLRIEANLKGRDTVYVEEFYDGPGNQGSARTFRNNETHWVTYDYENLQQVLLTWGDDGQPICSVANLTEFGFNIIPFHVRGGRPIIGSSSELFRFGEEFNETYVGQDLVRGIPVDHWVRTIVNPGGSSVDLSYYFSVLGYHTATNGSQVPVRATLNGTAPNRNGTNGTHPLNHVYEFFDVHVEPSRNSWSSVFKPPLGVSCVGRRRRKDLPRLPDFFKMGVEFLYSAGKHSRFSSLTVSYNYPGKMIEYSRAGVGRAVHDFNYGLSYTIDGGSGLCNITAFNTSSMVRFHPDYVISPDGRHVSVQNPTSFLIPPDQTWIYEGESTFRGLDVESWISEPFSMDGTNRTVEIFFASINYSSETFPSYVTHFPVQQIYRTQMGPNSSKVVLEIFAFSQRDLDPFDVSQCFSEDEQKPLSFDLEGEDNFKKYVQNNTVNFYHGVRESIMNVTGLPGSRVTHIEAEEGVNEVLSIFVTLLGVPKIEGNAVNSTQNHSIPLDEALKKLQSAIDRGTFEVNITAGEQSAQVPVVKGSLREDFSDEAETVTVTMGVSVGVTVGIAVFTLVIGLVIGLILIAFLQKKFNVKIPYLVQQDL